MEFSFQIHYRTNWGEEVRVMLSDGQLFPLYSYDGYTWRGNLSLDPRRFSDEIVYRYAIYREGCCVRKEWDGVKRRLALNPSYGHIILADSWRDRPNDSFCYSAAFTKAKKTYQTGTEESYERAILLKVHCPRLRKADWRLAISGNQKCLGNWDLRQAKQMQACGPNEWYILLDATQINQPFEYKFLAWNTRENQLGEWIEGDNRWLNTFPSLKGELLVLSDDEVHFSLPPWKAAGVAIPVFSLRSESSWGVGDFGDLKKMVDWAVLTGQRIIQILPINDTTMTHTWMDSYPYNSISIYAFHPMYIDPNQLPRLENAELQADFELERLRLNALPDVHYEEVNHLKLEYLKAIFAQEGAETMASKEFQQFTEENSDWLMPYAAFSYLRDRYKTPDFRTWPEFTTYDRDRIQAKLESDEEFRRSLHFYYYLQYLLHVQLLGASNYARKRGVLLKGDIPIGISRNSVEAWAEPNYFNMNGQAGAPPDPFSDKGQNWGFPTYKWDVMQQDNYRWWKHRMRKMATYFDAYRIDHLLGFFRIWEIPSHSVEGLLGHFVPSLPLSPAEIEQFGLVFRKEAFTKPYITEKILEQTFGMLTSQVKRTFVCRISHHEYALLPEFNTQRKVEAYFRERKDAESLALRAGLFQLINNVLFVADTTSPDLYHPRIAVQTASVYQNLTPEEQKAFNALYDDYFYHRHEVFWRNEAMRKLPELIDSTRMLVCGEDLGMIPECVPGVMEELRILSLEIQRMPKHPGETFGNPATYPYRSVCSISTHDMSTLRGWWRENKELTHRYFVEMLGGWGEAPENAPGWLCDSIVKQHLMGNSMLCILAWQDWLSIDEEVRNPDPDAERINIPSNPRHYWRYRMHLTIEQLLRCNRLNNRIHEMIRQSGRD